MAFAHSRCTSCAAPRCTPQINRGDSFGVQCRYKPNQNTLIVYFGNSSQKVDGLVKSIFHDFQTQHIVAQDRHRHSMLWSKIKFSTFYEGVNFLNYKKTTDKSYYQDISAWLSLILAAHHVQLRGVRRKSIVVIRSASNAATSQTKTP